MRGNETKQEKAKINLKRKMHGYILVCERSGCLNGFDEGLTLETSAFLPFTVANLRFQPSC